MPKRRHRWRSIREKSQMRRPSRWWMVGFLLATLLGGGIGYVALLGDVANSRGANFFMTPEGARLLAVGSGAGVGLLLVGLLFAVIYDESIGIGNSRRALFWCSLGILTVGIVGSLLGSFFLPKTLPIPLRVLFGAFIGLFGLGALIGVLADPKAALGEALFAGLEGCCSHIFVFFIALTGLVSGLLLWHTLLLGVLAGGGAALVTVILFTGLALTSRKEEVSHGSKTNAPISNPAYRA